MWSMAPSRSSTTATDRFEVQELGGEVLLGGRADVGQDGPGRLVADASSTPASAAGTRGRNSAATASWTSRVSAALHTPGRWVLALTTMRLGHVEVGGGVDVDVAVAVPVDHVRHRGVLADRGDAATGRPRGRGSR